jgi:hypothetical protein
MSIRELAKNWLQEHHSEAESNKLRASKYYSDKDIWFLTFDTSYFDASKSGYLSIMLQYEHDQSKFYLLKVPFSFFRTNREKFDIRSTGEKFDLHISAKKANWLNCERSDGVSFAEFEQ